ncbi:hypothetical protein QAD02_015005 [Eretmocerus hayati]|uniref:Uncharacterized protein n=1 Tax=Eretmocerus hayati TaxID=131215 RepID=A0ACC2P7X3_9HYME|nr:hypothetical protein QAD02_015005 [Eretmocerus hayati]
MGEPVLYEYDKPKEDGINEKQARRTTTGPMFGICGHGVKRTPESADPAKTVPLPVFTAEPDKKERGKLINEWSRRNLIENIDQRLTLNNFIKYFTNPPRWVKSICLCYPKLDALDLMEALRENPWMRIMMDVFDCIDEFPNAASVVEKEVTTSLNAPGRLRETNLNSSLDEAIKTMKTRVRCVVERIDYHYLEREELRNLQRDERDFARAERPAGVVNTVVRYVYFVK